MDNRLKAQELAAGRETSQERRTRKVGSFSVMEAALPALNNRYDASGFDKITSFLGKSNPFASPVSKRDTVWLFDNTAYRSAHFPHAWEAEYAAAYFRKNSGEEISDVVADIAEKIGLAGRGQQVEDRIERRIRPFVDTILPARTVTIRTTDGNEMKLGPSSRDGISSDVMRVPHHMGEMRDGSYMRTGTVLPSGERIEMTTHFAEPEGWLVVSDIDDTIKTTLTAQPLGILKTTFGDIPHAIDRMPDFYAHIHQLARPAWFYLSASPYNLYPFLHGFLFGTDESDPPHPNGPLYPPGPLLLREASWQNLSGFLTSLTMGTQHYKVTAIETINSRLPQRKVICVGDSTQTDPESYAEIYHKHPGWVKAIYIRRVVDVAETNEAGKNEPARFEKAFKGVPREVWRTFEQPEELYAPVEAVIAANR